MVRLLPLLLALEVDCSLHGDGEQRMLMTLGRVTLYTVIYWQILMRRLEESHQKQKWGS